MDRVELFTDGACQGNPGPGGWGVLLRCGHQERTLYGGCSNTTNNQMELMAAIEGLRAIVKPCQVKLTTDSQYVRLGIMQWIHRWKQNGWKTANKKSVKNAQLWQELDLQVRRHEHVEWCWIRGHSGHIDNERADRLAKKGINTCAKLS